MSLNKKKALIICILLMLPLTGLTISGLLYSYSFPNQFLHCFTADGYVYESVISTKDVTVITLDSDTYHDLTQYRPPDWTLSSLNITLTNITASTHEKVIEDYADQAVPLILGSEMLSIGAMGFTLTPGQRVYFDTISALIIKYPFNESAYVNIYILNATNHPSLGLIPNETLYIAYDQPVTGGSLELSLLSSRSR